uniref:Uncharacterized protein n=1 Tax=Amphora coffeiformis TaxID=265554 RepID=A0A7S3P840_9STRA
MAAPNMIEKYQRLDAKLHDGYFDQSERKDCVLRHECTNMMMPCVVSLYFIYSLIMSCVLVRTVPTPIPKTIFNLKMLPKKALSPVTPTIPAIYPTTISPDYGIM